MFSFKQFNEPINEALRKNAELFVGRFQPFHLGHVNVIEKMKDPVVVIIKGPKTSEDKQRNPLSFQQQIELIKTVFPNIPIFQAASADLPIIIADVSTHGYHVTAIYAGDDRMPKYQTMINSYNKKNKSPINVTFVETPRLSSGTTVRQAIRNNEFDLYKVLMPHQLATQEWFDTLRQEMLTEAENNSKNFIRCL